MEFFIFGGGGVQTTWKPSWAHHCKMKRNASMTCSSSGMMNAQKWPMTMLWEALHAERPRTTKHQRHRWKVDAATTAEYY